MAWCRPGDVPLSEPINYGYFNDAYMRYSASMSKMSLLVLFNILRPRQNSQHFADDILNCTFVNEEFRWKFHCIFSSKDSVNNKSWLNQITETTNYRNRWCPSLLPYSALIIQRQIAVMLLLCSLVHSFLFLWYNEIIHGQWTQDAKITSLLRQNDVATSF